MPTRADRTSEELEVDGRTIRISNPDKVLWPSVGWTKREMLRYYLAVAPAMVPHLRERPLTLGRFPDGVEARGWFQSNCRGAPDWLPVEPVVGRKGQRMRLCVVNDAAGLVWVANQGTVEFHPFLARRDRPQMPEVLVFDLDPGHPAALLACAAVALRLREVLAADGLHAYAKTSGGAGLHVYVPVGGGLSFDATKAYARSVAAALVAEAPGLVVDRQRRDLRAGKVLIDWLQNDPTRSTVAPYSLRATPIPLVSTPVTWEEIADAVRERREERLRLGPDAVLERVRAHGDLFAPVLRAPPVA
jgi:bifunctional non-homologous end joining protein LigD